MIWKQPNPSWKPNGWASVNKEKDEKKQMMKNITTAMKKSVLVKPAAMYTKSEAKAILGLSEGSSLVPSKYTGMGGRGKVPGTAIIAYLERSARVKVGRRYPSGTVSVVAR